MQQVAQQAPFNVVQELNKRLNDLLDKTPFPKERLTDKWVSNAIAYLWNASPSSINCSAKEMKSLMSVTKDNVTMTQFASLCNNLLSVKLKDFSGCNTDEYFDLQEESEKLSEYWNSKVESLKATVKRNMEAEIALLQRNSEAQKQMPQA